jgi:hypothetical protein
MALEIFDFEQGSDQWKAARLGLPTASRFGDILAKGEGKMRRKYLYELAGEIMTGEPAESFSNAHMERGKVMEDEARDFYAFTTDADLRRVGFIRNGGVGCSPDSLIGEAGALEVKTKLAHLMVDAWVKDDFPPEHKAQCQGVLWVAEREWIDIVCYWPKMPTFIKRAHRDEKYIATLEKEVAQFTRELAALVDYLRYKGGDPTHSRNALRQALTASLGAA